MVVPIDTCGGDNMNSTLFQLARLVSYVRTSLNSGSIAQFHLSNSEDSIIYKSAYGDTISSSEEWVKALGERKLKHIFLLIDVAGNNREHAGFANAERQSIITIFPDNLVTYWTPLWEFDKPKGKWTITYTEQIWENAPRGVPTFGSKIEAFKNVLKDIAELAGKIKFEGFKNTFLEAYNILAESDEPALPEWMADTIPALEPEKLRMFLAASKADVFGCMGSWNDSPPYMAHKKGLIREYDTLSQELYVQTREAVMFAVNS